MRIFLVNIFLYQKYKQWGLGYDRLVIDSKIEARLVNLNVIEIRFYFLNQCNCN